MKFSIVMPVYNTELYLEKAILSVINQTYRDWELIIVNDASPDQSMEIISKYTELDKRIKLMNKPQNEGLIRARLSGFKIAKGDYILNLDSDDAFNKELLFSIVKFVEEFGELDLISFNLCRVTKENKEIYVQENIFKNSVINKMDFLSIYLNSSRLNPICGKAIKCGILKQIKLSENEKLVKGGEDRLLIAKSLSLCDTFGYLDKPLYYYTYNEESISSSSYLTHGRDVCVTGNYIFENLVSEIHDKQLIQGFINDFSGRFFSVLRALFLWNDKLTYEEKKKKSIELKSFYIVQVMLDQVHKSGLSFTGKLYLFFYKRENFYLLVKSWQTVVFVKKITRGKK